MAEISLEQMLQAGVHFDIKPNIGTQKWNSTFLVSGIKFT